VVGEAGNGDEALRMVEELRPDLVVLDVSIPGRSGIQIAYDISCLFPKTCVMIVSMHSRVDYVVKAFQAGATGYVIKESAADKLVQGLEAVLRGEYFLDDALSCQVVERLLESSKRKSKITDPAYGTLTPREQEIMRLLAEGLSPKEIAKRLYISQKTVENHRARIMSKLNLNSAVELVHYAAKLGLIDIELWKD
jgi:RNA polymerase sigma factor (sigma-70 family)